MSELIAFPPDPTDEQLARLYRFQVLELEEFALFTSTPDGRITTWNRGVEKVFGYTQQEWVGQHVSIIFNDDDRRLELSKKRWLSQPNRDGASTCGGISEKTGVWST